jgi:regulator of protease activity HflC (stomatin/prohibitin superfamily)
VDWLNKPRTWVVLGVVAASLILLLNLWWWEVERVEVPPGSFLVKINLWGQDLPAGEIIAPDSSYKGVQLDVLREGRHWLNPLFYRYEIHKLENVPMGQCLVLTRKFGTAIPEERRQKGDILARSDGERGIVAEPIREPGKYPINPHAYAKQLVDAVRIGPQQIGVRFLRVGKDPHELPPDPGRSPYLVSDGYRGVQEKTVPPGDHLINPHAEWIVPVETKSFIVRFTDIYFPSKDGFTLNPHVIVKYSVRPEKAPLLLVTLTDEGRLYQKDDTPEDQEKNPILQKVVLPLVRGYVRIEGSKFDARDFIAKESGDGAPATVNARERLQKELKTNVPPRCRDIGVEIEDITLDKLEVSGELATLAALIADREQARLQREQNKSTIDRHKQEQITKASEALKPQRTAIEQANTRLQEATIKAMQKKETETKRLEQELASAQIRLDAAKLKAKEVLAKGQAEADVIELNNEAQVSGLKKAVQGFPSIETFAQYHMLAKLAPALAEIFASDQSDFAKLFAGYMTPGPAKLAGPPPGGNTGTGPR